MFSRHKPGAEWKQGEDYPDFNTIKADQSFNWSAYSIPIWTRFNDQKIYYADYGVMAYSVKTILFIKKRLNQHEDYFKLDHKPVDYNYSHCELLGDISDKNKTERREIRMIFKHNCMVKFMPFEQMGYSLPWKEILMMYLHRIYSKWTLIK